MELKVDIVAQKTPQEEGEGGAQVRKEFPVLVFSSKRVRAEDFQYRPPVHGITLVVHGPSLVGSE
jgi:hypothetical protein